MSSTYTSFVGLVRAAAEEDRLGGTHERESMPRPCAGHVAGRRGLRPAHFYLHAIADRHCAGPRSSSRTWQPLGVCLGARGGASVHTARLCGVPRSPLRSIVAG